MRKPRLIVLNGPPHVGKDTIAKIFVDREGYAELTFKDQLISAAIAVARIDRETWRGRYEDRQLKEEPWGRLGGLSQRQYLIKVSEEWVKPLFGRDWFGKCLAATAAEMLDDEIIVSDGGFPEEVLAVAAQSGHEVHLVRLHRPGYTFEGDSRDYVFNVIQREHDVHLEEGDPYSAVMRILELCNPGR